MPVPSVPVALPGAGKFRLSIALCLGPGPHTSSPHLRENEVGARKMLSSGRGPEAGVGSGGQPPVGTGLSCPAVNLL